MYLQPLTGGIVDFAPQCTVRVSVPTMRGVLVMCHPLTIGNAFIAGFRQQLRNLAESHVSVVLVCGTEYHTTNRPKTPCAVVHSPPPTLPTPVCEASEPRDCITKPMLPSGACTALYTVEDLPY